MTVFFLGIYPSPRNRPWGTRFTQVEKT